MSVRLTADRQPIPVDTLTGAALFAAGLAAYTSTLAPTVLNGDAALFQYTPLVLGVTYPTGYPVYLLLARLWLALVPVGEVAWRMNLFSAGCGALALPFLYGAARRLLQNRAAAVSSVLLFATLPTYWRWATEAKIYTLNILLFSIVLWLAARGEEEGGWPARLRYTLAALALGLQVGVHSTTALLIPGVLLLFRLNGRAQKRNRLPRKIIVKQAATHVALFALPLTAYLYVPLRAEWLIARYGRETAIARGLLADFYHSGLSGWLRYFTAADFTGGVVTNWGNVPAELFTVYFDRLLPLDFTGWGVAWGLVGMLIVSLHPPLRRRLWPFFLLYALPIPFVLTYGQGEQNAFLLTSNLTFALFAGAAVAFAIYVLRFAFYAPRTTRHASQLAAITLFALTLLLPIRHTRYNLNWLQNKWNTASREYWAEALAHPLEEGAGVMATWGDLTSMWYMQHAEGRRPDLPGLYPPTEAVAADWLARGNPLYVAGPVLDDWPPAAVARYRLIPWGRLVRLTPRAADPRALLPPLDPSRQTTFGGRLRLLGADFPAQVPSGGRLEAYFSLLALSNLPEGTLYSLRLAQGDSIVAQRDDAIRPGWFPRPAIPAGQPLVGAYTVDLPPGTLPGEYRLQLAVYHQPGQEWRMADGSRVFDLGPVAVQFTPAAGRPGPDRFGRELALDESRISVKRARQGKGFALHLLWRTLEPPADNYTLLAEMVDGAGQVWRDWRVPVDTASWRAEQQVRLLLDLTIPAEFPPGDETLTLRLRWLRPDGTPLPHRRWLLPAGDSLTLDGPRVLAKENRRFDPPPVAGKVVDVNFDNKVALVGFAMPSGLSLAGSPSLPVTLYWQGRGDMREVYIVFVHLVDGAGQVVAQHDGVPAQGREPTTSWAVGEYVTDRVEIPLPPGLPPGEYAVRVGLYLPATGERLRMLYGEQNLPLDDFFSPGTVTVKQ